MLRLKSLGQTLIEADDARLTPTAETVFAVALYLIVEAGRPVGRDELTSLLWSGVSEARAQHGLRQALYRLKILGAIIRADRSSLILSPRFCSMDFAPLVTPQPIAALEQFAETIEGPFLPGYDPQLSEAFTAWVDRQRDVVHSALARTLVAGMQAKKRVSDWGGAERLATMCLSIDPLNEEATLTVAEAAALGGSKSKALSILNHYLKEIGEGAGEIRLPAALLRRRISEAFQDSSFSAREAPFVGRSQQIAELKCTLDRAITGRGSVNVIWGEPGIGKTRLVSEFARMTVLHEVQVVRVECQAHDVRRPLSAFIDLIQKLLLLPGALGCSPESMQYLRRLVAHDPEAARVREQLEMPGINYDLARQAVLDVLDSVSTESCTTLILEDAHWLDSQSTRLIAEIAAWLTTRRISVLITSRNSALASENVAAIMLQPLETHASSAIAHSLSKREAAGEDFLMWCVASSGGNPYYLLELLRNGTQAISGYRAPQSLTRLLHGRVLSLSTGARQLLEACCVLAKHSTLERIESCLDVRRTVLLQAMDELEFSGMVEVQGDRILSRHDLLTSVVIAQMSLAARSMLHRFAAEMLEEEAATTQAVGLIWDAAEHWLAACDAPRAIQSLRRCGSHLLDIGMPYEAVRVFERAASLTSSTELKYSIGADRARALLDAESSLEALKLLEELLRLRDIIIPRPSILDEVGVMYMRARWNAGDDLPMLVQSLLTALAADSASPRERVSTATWLLTAADNMCDLSLGRVIYAQIADQLEHAEVSLENRLSFEMVYHCSFGDARCAVSLADRLVRFAMEKCSPILTQRILRHASFVHHCHGTMSRAIRLAEDALEVAEALAVPGMITVCSGTLVSLLMDNGDLDAAVLLINHALERYTPGSDSVVDSNLWSYRTELAIRRGDPVRGEEFLAKALPSVEKTRSRRSLSRRYALECRIEILKFGAVSETLLEVFSAAFEVTMACTHQDFNAESLILGLVSAGRVCDAHELAIEFLTVTRRDLSPVPYTFAQTLKRLFPESTSIKAALVN